MVNPMATGMDGDRSLLDVVQGLAARGHEIMTVARPGHPFLAAASRAGLPTQPLPEWLEVERDLDARRDLDASLGIRGLMPRARALMSLRRILQAHRIQIAIIDDSTPRLALGMAALGLGIEIVQVFDPRLPLSPRTRVERPTFAGHWVIHAPESLGALLAHHGPRVDPGAVTLIPHSIDLEALGIDRRMARRTVRRDLGCRETDPVVVAMGSPAPGRDVEVVVEALALLGGRAPRTVWLEGVAETARPDWIEKAEARGVPLRPGSGESLSTLLAAADAAVITSSRDRMPLALLMAMVLGVPVVASSVDDHRSLLGSEDVRPPRAGLHGGLAPRGLLVAPGDAPGLSAAIEEILQNPEPARLRAAAAQAYVQDHHDLRRVISVWERWLGGLGTRRHGGDGPPLLS